LRRLPVNSTPVDFAFEIHSRVGYNCIGAKVNGKIVPLDTILHSGDQIEIIQSKNQHPNKSWLQFVRTHKAKANIRKYLNKEEEKIVELGKELWAKKLKKLKLSFAKEEVDKFVRKLRLDNSKVFFRDIAQNKIDIEELLNPKEKKDQKPLPDLEFEKFASLARTTAGGVLVDGEYKGIVYNYAKCCNPIPGDPIVGFITIGEGIKIHRKSCSNLINMAKRHEKKLIPVQWPATDGTNFVAGIRIKGDDAPGILKDLSNCITTYKSTNIKSVNISTGDSMFNGTITVYVDDLNHLIKLIERLKKTRGIYTVERFDAEN
jgi:(p)ppGpp synthase/HD superfamily hydrolase